MNQKENGALKAIAQHVGVLNKELGSVKNDISLIKKDICWIKKIGYFLGTILTIGVGKVVFFG